MASGVVSLMKWIRWRETFRALIIFLSMCRGVYMSKILCIFCFCRLLSSLDEELTVFLCRDQGVSKFNVVY